MTAKQKANAQRFKKAIAEAKKLRSKNPKLTQAQAVKQAWAILYKGGKVSGTKTKKAMPKSYHKDTKSHNVRINVMSGLKRKLIFPLPYEMNLKIAKQELPILENNLKWDNAIIKSANLNIHEKKELRNKIKNTKGYINALKNYIKKQK